MTPRATMSEATLRSGYTTSVSAAMNATATTIPSQRAGGVGRNNGDSGRARIARLAYPRPPRAPEALARRLRAARFAAATSAALSQNPVRCEQTGEVGLDLRQVMDCGAYMLLVRQP